MYFELDLTANAECQDVRAEIFLNQQKIFESTADNKIFTVRQELDDSAGEHVIEVIMSGKQHQHTQTDDAGHITSDVYFQITRIEFEQLDLTKVFCQGLECYTHSFNSTQPEILDEFYGILGCNGKVEIKFSTPIYLWLLDKIS